MTLTIFIDYIIQVFAQPSLNLVQHKHSPRVCGTQQIITQVSVKLPESAFENRSGSPIFTIHPTSRVLYLLQKTTKTSNFSPNLRIIIRQKRPTIKLLPSFSETLRYLIWLWYAELETWMGIMKSHEDLQLVNPPEERDSPSSSGGPAVEDTRK